MPFATLRTVMLKVCVSLPLDVMLAEWNGAPLAEGSFVYIEFIRKDAKYVMYQNLDSFGTRKLTGRFVIDNDAELGAVIRGSYDYGAGAEQREGRQKGRKSQKSFHMTCFYPVSYSVSPNSIHNMR